jgi:hypothetical protein
MRDSDRLSIHAALTKTARLVFRFGRFRIFFKPFACHIFLTRAFGAHRKYHPVK